MSNTAHFSATAAFGPVYGHSPEAAFYIVAGAGKPELTHIYLPLVLRNP